MKQIILFFILLAILFSADSSAKNVIKFFHDNDFSVDKLKDELEELGLSEPFELQAYNIDEKANATEKLNKIVKGVVESRTNKNDSDFDPQQAYSDGFNDLVNNQKRWQPIYQSLENGAKTISLLIRFNIKKTPAFVFNDKDIIYGAMSLQAAELIYLENREEQ